jgi:hypothetical protein
VPSSTTIAAQLNQYLETKFDKETDECLSFWVDNRNIFDKLFIPAIVALSVPASSAPVERVFSFSGIFCRPHRSRISDANLERLTFLRCNRLYFRFLVLLEIIVVFVNSYSVLEPIILVLIQLYFGNSF